MNMGMQDGLTGRDAAVGPDVEAAHRRIRLSDAPGKGADQGPAVVKLLVGHGKPVGRVPEGNDQKMTVGNRKTILDSRHRTGAFNEGAFPDPAAKQAIRTLRRVPLGVDRHAILRHLRWMAVMDHSRPEMFV
ncbi:hypothetical protein DESC_870089 [Desulfosarcina cetonica]|nr:hypothetical protein DESC_870089 [Desulfosarcina cetonica]